MDFYIHGFDGIIVLSTVQEIGAENRKTTRRTMRVCQSKLKLAKKIPQTEPWIVFLYFH